MRRCELRPRALFTGTSLLPPVELGTGATGEEKGLGDAVWGGAVTRGRGVTGVNQCRSRKDEQRGPQVTPPPAQRTLDRRCRQSGGGWGEVGVRRPRASWSQSLEWPVG
ncbi:hypothetical protein NDU88_007486 [Pleurodeles waltl]|uniref:Uncharacterized protein n=1 Tax=Pleurodeles waltl TaxID=8319 RepID=A0AAV7N289_PLEWA|nr:hypothetical protein NDU88_007486 [Pleurodeles waltl]